jgi:hypothetical protein
METKFQTSFIPKSNLEQNVAQGGSRGPVGFFTFIASIIFFISVLVAGGVFGYNKYLESLVASSKDSLDKNIKSFEPQTIEEYVRLNSRIDSAKKLLDKHIAISYVLDFLEEKTIQSVGFSDFKYDVDAGGEASLTMNGQAKGYNSVAYQAELFGRERALKSPLFSNLDVDVSGNVVFNFTTRIDPVFISYKKKAERLNINDSADINSLPDSSVTRDESTTVPPTVSTPTSTTTQNTNIRPQPNLKK